MDTEKQIMSNTKSNTIDWDFHRMVKGKCTGTGCPIKIKCEHYTAVKFDKAYGIFRPPYFFNEDLNTTVFPPKCKDFLTNESHKPALQRFEIED